MQRMSLCTRYPSGLRCTTDGKAINRSARCLNADEYKPPTSAGVTP
ncbi:MAG: hypothetical protein WBP00_19775 [Saprospiraceae bacterium]